MADLLLFIATNWNVFDKETQKDILKKYSTRTERRKHGDNMTISDLSAFKPYAK